MQVGRAACRRCSSQPTGRHQHDGEPERAPPKRAWNGLPSRASVHCALPRRLGASGDARLRGKLINAPIPIEIVTKKDFNNSPSDFYGTVLSKKGLDVTLSSITYKTYSTRGFNGSGSSRVNQIMDGMDNQAPGLNFSVGNFVGITDLDIESIEILPGASSALYGPGGMNGTIILNSKNPFKTPGLSLIVKNGVTDIGKMQRDKAGLYSDYTFR